jgi:MtN3 and saliva related transmembrane protein
MDYTTLLGLTAGTLTTTAYLPQLLKTWRSKSADDISWSMIITLCIGILLWLVYGSYTHNLPVICANVMTFAFTFFILLLKIRYRSLSLSRVEE